MLEFDSIPKFDSLEDLICKSAKDVKEVEVKHKDGDCFSGGETSSNCKITVTKQDGSRQDLFAKILKKESDASEKIWDIYWFLFRKEVVFYQQILPALIPDDSIFNVVPRCAAVGNIDNDVHIVLDDFEKRGFSVVKIDEFMDRDSVAKCLRALARFHSISCGKAEELEEWGTVLKDRVHDPSDPETKDLYFGQPYESNLRLMAAILKSKDKLIDKLGKIPEGVDDKMLERLIKLAPQMIKVFRAMRTPRRDDKVGPFLLHGDYHMFNVAMNKDADTAVMVDFQLVCRGSPACDLIQFISQCPPPQDRIQLKDHFLQIYLDEFNKNAKDGQIKMEDLKQDFKGKAPIGLYCDFAYGLRRFVSKQDDSFVDSAINLAVENGDANKIVENLGKCGEKFWRAIHCNFQMLDEFCNKMGCIETIEEFVKDL